MFGRIKAIAPCALTVSGSLELGYVRYGCTTNEMGTIKVM